MADRRPWQHTVRAAAKTGVRKLVRSRGYDIVPIAAGLAPMQQRLLAECDAAVDVGANVGQFAERLRDLGYAGPVISFEPGTEAYAILQRKSAQDPQWDARRAAIGEQVGTAELHVSGNSVSSSLLEMGRTHLQAAPKSAEVARERVSVSTLDAELADVPYTDLYLKLDVQGFELPALRGAEVTLKRTRAVQTEVSFDTLYAGQSDWLDVCGLLQDSGFLVKYVEPGYEDPASGTMLQADFLFVRAEHSTTTARS